jgi:gliding motility-associated-like protein
MSCEIAFYVLTCGYVISKLQFSLTSKLFLAVLISFSLWSFNARAQGCGSVDFITTSSKICAPDSGVFQAVGVPPGSKFYWNLGSGFLQGPQVASKVYTSSGNITISLIVELPGGSLCDTVIKPGFLKVNAAPTPVVGTYPSKVLCNGPDTVEFTDSTVGSITSNWIVDGWPYNNTKNFSHVFTSYGSKDVTLTITDANNCSKTLTQSGFIKVNRAPDVDFCITASQNKTNIVANFKHNIIPRGNVIKSYNWQFPGGTPSSSTLANPPAVTYSDLTKKYDVSLSVTTADGCTYNFQRTNFIQKFIGTNKDSICTSETVIVSNLSNNNGRGFFSIDIIGGSVLGGTAETGFTLAYPIPGKYNMVFKYKYKPDGCENVISLPQYINVKGPRALFESLDRFSCKTPDTIHFDNRSLLSAGITTFQWHFVDPDGLKVPGTPLYTTGPIDTSIILTKKGEYDVKLVAISTNGCKDSSVQQRYVRIQDPIADFYTNTPIACAGDKIIVVDTVKPVDDPDYPYTYNWVVTHADDPFLFYNYGGKKPNFFLTVPGRYHVMLIVKNGDNCVDTIIKNNFLTIKGIRAEINVNASGGCPPYTTQASINVLSNSPPSPLTYEWIVSPATGVTMSNPSGPSTYLLFKKSNCYDLSMTLTNTDGCSLTVYKKAAVCIGVKSGFGVDTILCKRQPVQLIDSTQFGPTFFKWSASPPDVTFFPNDADISPKATFMRDTTYTITQVVGRMINNLMCFDTTVKQVIIPAIKADFKSNDSVRFCAPVTVNFINQSVGAAEYFWDFGDGTTLLTTNPNPSHNYTINNSNGYTVKMIAYSSMGCSDTIIKPNGIRIIGPTPTFSMSDDKFCGSGSISFTNKSKNVPFYIFDYGDGNSDTNKMSPHVYNYVNQGSDSTIYNVVMLAKDGFCPAGITFRDTVVIYKPAAANFAADTTDGCAPLNVIFSDLSFTSVQRSWFLNADAIPDDSLITAKFKYTLPGIYSVKLKITNQYGCTDSITRVNYINTTVPPMAKFSRDKNKGCHEATIKFTNLSSNYDHFTMDYGDNSAPDSDVVSAHTYSFDYNLSADSMVFIPRLRAVNANGCDSTFTDTIVLYRKAPSSFGAAVTSGCPPFTAQFLDSTMEVAERKWDFNEDWTSDDTSTNAKFIFAPGTYDVRLITTSNSGCTDTVIKTDYITVFSFPTGDIILLDSSVCPGDTIHFASKDTSPSAKIRWNFGDPMTIADTATGTTGAYPYGTPGTYTVSIHVEDSNGCILDFAKPDLVFIPNIPPPPVPYIQVVTVENNSHVKLSWKKNIYPEFRKYELYRNYNGTETLIFSSTDINDTAYTDNNIPMDVSLHAYTYTVFLENNCGKTISGGPHTSILLKVGTSPQNANALVWNQYRGWSGIKYNIYRSENGSPYKMILATTDTSYNDSAICDFNYCYYIEASGLNSEYKSVSNTGCNHPPYIYQNGPLEIYSTTVNNNSVVHTTWGKSEQPNIKEYIVDRFDRFKGWQLRYGYTTDTSFTDASVQVNKEYYRYQVSVKDKCQNLSPVSNKGTSILLKSRIHDDKVLLTWNAYSEWSNGVAGYKLQLEDRKYGFKTIKELTATDTIYTDPELHREIDTAFCYRVIAMENSPEPDSSVSNISCSILPSRIFIPSAFTPNDDGLNDLFHISYTSLFNLTGTTMTAYDMKIFNRWGSLVFQTNDANKGWDGTFNGEPVEIGVYMYSINASGLDNTDYNLGGTVTLLR